MPSESVKRHLPRFADFSADDQEVAFAREVLVPTVASVAAAAVTFGVARACCRSA